MKTSVHRQASAVLEEMADGFYTVDRRWRLTYFSPRAERYFSLASKDLLGKILWEAFPNVAGSVLEERFREAIAHGRPQRFQARGTTTGRWVQIHAVPSREGLAVAFYDLSAEARAGAELRSIYATAPVGLCFYDTDLRYASINDQLARWNGLPVEAQLGRTLSELMPEKAEVLEPLLRRVIETGVPMIDADLEFEQAGAPGDRHWLVSYHPIKSPDGTVLGVNGVAQNISGLKRQDEALRRSESRFRMLIDAIPNLVWLNGADGSSLAENQRFREYFGTTVKETGEAGWAGLLHPEEHAAVIDRWRYSVQTGRPFEKELRLKRYDGTYRWHLARSLPVRNAHGEVELWCGTSTDIHDFVQTEQALRESEERFRQAADSIKEVLWIRDVEPARSVYVNPAFEKIWGIPAQHIYDNEHAWSDAIHEEDRPGVADSFRRWIAGELDTFDVDYRIVRADGEIRWIHDSGTLLLDGDGQPYRVVGVAEDITVRQTAEEKIHFQASLINAVEQAVMATDLEGRIIAWNRFAEVLYGWTAEEVLGRYIVDVIPPPGLKARAVNIMSQLQRGESWSGEMDLQRRDGSVFPAYVIDSPILDPSGILIGIVGVSMDISAQKDVEDALRTAKDAAEAANDAKGVFLANMSHEIRTPLTGMIGFATLLSRQLDGKAKTYAQRIEEGGRRLTETLSAVLTLARLETGRIEVQLQGLAVAPEVREITTLYQAQAERKGLDLRFRATPAAGNACALLDRGALSSILQNLISNAIKFTEKGAITVTVDAAGAESSNGQRRVYIHVEDTGIGIEPAFMPNLFEPFLQESTGLSRSHEGTGLGLSIARQLAEKMQGTITVASEKHRGSHFTISFPLTGKARLTSPRPVAVNGSSAGTLRPRMLIVEDHADTRLFIQTLLEERCAVTVARNSMEALEAVRMAGDSGDGPFDAILLDVNLGSGQDGTSLLRTILGMPLYASVPIAALTARAMPGDRERFLKEGFSAYLRKPFVPDELHDLVAGLLNGRAVP